MQSLCIIALLVGAHSSSPSSGHCYPGMGPFGSHEECRALPQGKCTQQTACYWLPDITVKPFATLPGDGNVDFLALPKGGLAVATGKHVQLYRAGDFEEGGKPYASLTLPRFVRKLVALQDGGLAAVHSLGISLFNASTITAGASVPYKMLKGEWQYEVKAFAEFATGGPYVTADFSDNGQDPHSSADAYDFNSQHLAQLEIGTLEAAIPTSFVTRLMDGRVAVGAPDGYNIYNSSLQKTVSLGGSSSWNFAELSNGYIAMGGNPNCVVPICPAEINLFTSQAAASGGSGKSYGKLVVEKMSDSLLALPDGGLAAGTRAGTISLFSGPGVKAAAPPYARLQCAGTVEAMVSLTGMKTPTVLAALSRSFKYPFTTAVELFHIPSPPTGVLEYQNPKSDINTYIV